MALIGWRSHGEVRRPLRQFPFAWLTPHAVESMPELRRNEAGGGFRSQLRSPVLPHVRCDGDCRTPLNAGRRGPKPHPATIRFESVSVGAPILEASTECTDNRGIGDSKGGTRSPRRLVARDFEGVRMGRSRGGLFPPTVS